MTRKRVTMKDIADRLNLSINAVSLALNDKTGVGEETKRLILNTAEEMGYLDQSVKYMQNYSNKNICVLLKNRFFRDFRFYGRVLLGIEEEAKKAGYDVFFSSFENGRYSDMRGKSEGCRNYCSWKDRRFISSTFERIWRSDCVSRLQLT